MDTQSVQFDDGICPACRWAEEKPSIDWEFRKNSLLQICDKYRRTDGGYDVIVPSSGGKDSRFVSHLLREEYGMNPLSITWAPNIWTDIGTTNFRSQADYGVSNILVTPRQDVHRRLTQIAFQELGHPFQPFNIGQRILALKYASYLSVPLIVYGENVGEYSNRVQDNYVAEVKTEQYDGFRLSNCDMRISGRLFSELNSIGIFARELENYILPEDLPSASRRITYTYMSYFINWNPMKNFFYAAEKTGFFPQSERKPGTYCRHSGLDDYIEELHFYLMLCKFGNGRCTWDACQEIRSGYISRSQAVALVRKYETEFPYGSLNKFLEYFNMEEPLFWKTINKFRNPLLWKSTRHNPMYPEDFEYLGYPS